MTSLVWTPPITISNPNAFDPQIVIDDNGNATALWIEKSAYTGTASQSGTTVTGSGTTFTSDMVGGTIIYNNGMTCDITGFTSTTVLTTSQSVTAASQTFIIYYNGIITTSYLPFSSSWGMPQQLSTFGNNARTPKIAIDSNAIIYAVWEENTVINYTSYVTGSWVTVTSISTGTGATQPTLAVDPAGNVVVAWVQAGNIMTINKPVASIWSYVTTFTSSNSDHPDIALGGDITTVIWHAVSFGFDQILTATSNSLGSSFSSPTNIIQDADSGHNHNYPKVAVDFKGDSLAIWYKSDLGGINVTDYINVFVVGAELKANADSWNTPQIISDIGMANPQDLKIKCQFDAVGNGYATWILSSRGNQFNLENTVKKVGGVLNFQNTIISNNNIPLLMDISTTTISELLLVYSYFDGTYTTIQSSQTNISGAISNFYTGPYQVSDVSTNNTHPSCAMSLTGTTVNTVAVWETFDTMSNEVFIQAAVGSRTIVSSPSNLIITQVTNNYGVFNQYDNVLTWDASTDPALQGYNIYRNGIYIDFVSAFQPCSYTDGHSPQSGTGVTTTYSIASLDTSNLQGLYLTDSIS